MDYSNYESEEQYNRRKEYYRQSIKDCKHESLSMLFTTEWFICTKCMKTFGVPMIGLN